MDYGPIHSEVYDLIKGGHSDQAEWSSHFQNESFYVRLAHDLGVAALSRYEVGILNEISEQYLGYDDWDVAGATHKLAEYTQSYRQGTSTPIPLEQLVEAVGRGAEKDAILRDAEEKAFFDKMFSESK